MVRLKYLVTGGNGFLGKHVCELLRKEYGEKHVVSLKSSECDLTCQEDSFDLFDWFKPENVIHLAALVGGILANKAEPGRFGYTNMQMGLNVLENCRLYNSKLIAVGTCCSYPCHAPTPFQEKYLNEGFPEPSNAPYGLAKRQLMNFMIDYEKQYKLRGCFLVPANLYGEGDNFDEQTSHFIPAIIRKIHRAKYDGSDHIFLVGDGTATRDLLYVKDASEAILKATKYDGPIEPINIGTGKEHSIAAVAYTICELMEFDGHIVFDNCSTSNGQQRRCLDVSKAKRKLDWEASTHLVEGLKNTIKWFERIYEPYEY